MELWKTVPDGAREVLAGGCPSCRSQRTHRSRTRGRLDALVRAFTPLRPFSCSQCHWRGWRVPVASQGPMNELPPAEERRRSGRRPQRTSAGRPIFTPSQLERRKARRRLVLVIALAFLAGSTLALCHDDENAMPEQTF